MYTAYAHNNVLVLLKVQIFRSKMQYMYLRRPKISFFATLNFLDPDSESGLGSAESGSIPGSPHCYQTRRAEGNRDLNLVMCTVHILMNLPNLISCEATGTVNCRSTAANFFRNEPVNLEVIYS